MVGGFTGPESSYRYGWNAADFGLLAPAVTLVDGRYVLTNSFEFPNTLASDSANGPGFWTNANFQFAPLPETVPVFSPVGLVLLVGSVIAAASLRARL